MSRLTAIVASIVAVCLVLCSCPAGSETTLDATRSRAPSWAHVSDSQLDASVQLGVPVAFENDLGMRFVLIPAGTFLMGSPEDEGGRDRDEEQHEVTVPRPLYVQITEVTNKEFQRFRPSHPGLNPESFTEWVGDPRALDDRVPAAMVLPEDAERFCEWLTRRSQHHSYRLPTEEEWEYACRAGSRTAYNVGARIAIADANFSPASPARARGPDGFAGTVRGVAAYAPNDWGLYDMHGNVSEWCQGQAELAGLRMGRARGGGWASAEKYLRSADRNLMPWDVPRPDVGFRVIAEVKRPNDLDARSRR